MSSDQVVAGDIPSEPPGFLPRPDLLAEADRTGAGTPAVHALTGPPGAGKTQLAAAYARAKLAAGWRLIAWVNAGTTGTLLAGLAATADAAGLSGGGRPDTADPGLAVRRWLESDGDRCLLVFDDADDPGALQPYLPAEGAARVLITTRSAASPGVSVPVDVYTPEEALAFLAGRTGLADDAGAAAVAAELGCLPLALAQAAAVIGGQHLGCQAYLDRLRAVQVGEDLARQTGQPGPPGVVQAVLLSLDAVRAADRTGVCARAIQIMAVLSAAGVRRELLHAAGRAGVLAPGGRRVAAAEVDQALAQLAERSLVTPNLNGQAVIIGRVVAQVVRAGLAQGELRAACRAAAAVLEARARALDAAPDRPAVREFPEQVTALLGHVAESAGERDEALARILLRLRFLALYHLIELGDSAAQAIAVGEPLTADLRRALGPHHPDTLNARNSLAAAYQAAGRAGEAVPLFEHTLLGLERSLGPEHPDTLTSQNNLAATYQDVGRFAEAILLFKLTLAARERLLGADHPSTLNSRSNLAAAYRAAGRVAEAIPLLEQTLAGRERVLGASHPLTQASRDNLDSAHRDAARPAEEIPPAEQPPAEQPAAEQPPAGRPPAEQPAVEQPVAEQPPAGQPPADDEAPDEPTPAPAPEPGMLRPEPPARAGPGPRGRPARRGSASPSWPRRS